MAAESLEQIALHIRDSEPIKAAITALQQCKAHPITVQLLVNGVIPRVIKLKIFESVNIADYKKRQLGTAGVEPEHVQELKTEIDTLFSYLIQTPKGPRRNKY